MRKLSFRTVFSKYKLSFTDYLARWSYSVYRNVRLGLSRFFPLKEDEEHMLKDIRFREEPSSTMPKGYNYLEKKEDPGYLRLKYIDFFDYLPKEDLSKFKKEHSYFVRKNKLSRYGVFQTKRDRENLSSLERYVDWEFFSTLPTVEIKKRKSISHCFSYVAISIRNLSSSFLLVNYRIFITDEFNQALEQICKSDYKPYSDVSRQFNIPWYKPKRFGRAMYTGDDLRRKEYYQLLSKLKWNAFSDLSRYFTFHFAQNNLFPPTFQTFSTNIRPDKTRKNSGCWNSVMLRSPIDYAPELNACVCWDYDCSQNEGTCLSVYSGGNYTGSGILPEIAEYDLASVFSTYMTASSMRRIAERDIAACNRKISNAIRHARTSGILRTRVNVERKLYYSYRFICEFSGETIDNSDCKYFSLDLDKKRSYMQMSFDGITESVKDTKASIDSLLHMLNDAAEYRSTSANITLQWFMTIITLLSLLIAAGSVFGFASFDFSSLVDSIKAIIKAICQIFIDLMR